MASLNNILYLVRNILLLGIFPVDTDDAPALELREI